MVEAPIPANEADRLAALRRVDLFDTPLEERFERITRLVCRLLGVPTAMISLVDEARQWFKSVQGSELTETPRRIAFCAHAILNDEVMVVPDATKDRRFADNPLVTGSEGIGFYAGHPLKTADGHRVGVLCAIDHKPREFSKDDLQTLRDLAALAEVELNARTLVNSENGMRVQLEAERRRALIDPLTRLWNRDGIMDILRREHARALRHGEHLGVLMADLDYFKRINDEHGHPAGDAVLRELAKRMLSAVREFDAIGRIGGDEFLVVLPFKSGKRSLDVIAARVCDQVKERMVKIPAGTLSITVSVGGVEKTVTSTDGIEEMIKMADEALYRAKKLGRNCSEVQSGERGISIPPALTVAAVLT